jgi:predicted Zn-dependent protease with MMP-like domain
MISPVQTYLTPSCFGLSDETCCRLEDVPPHQSSPQSGQQRRLLLGIFHGVPTTKKSIFDLPTGPDDIVLYQKNIEAVCSSTPATSAVY